MNLGVVGKLIAKDFYFGRFMLVCFMGAGLLALVAQVLLLESDNRAARIIALVLFYGVLNGLIWMPIHSISGERRLQTLTFLMSLPISIGDYTAGKIVSNLLQFMVPWLVLGGSMVIFISASESIADGYIPIVLLLMVQLLAYFVLILCIALVTESMVAAQIVGIAANIVYWFSWSFLGVAPGMGLYPDPESTWEAIGRAMLIGHVAAIPVIFVLALYLQSRKRDFL